MKGLAIAGTLTALGCAGLLFEQEIRDFADASGRPCGPPREAVFELFDKDHDERLSAEEIEQAATALMARDANGDGMLTQDELPQSRPPRPRRGRSGPDDAGFRPGADDGRQHRQRPARDNIPESAQEAGTVLFEDGYLTDDRDGGRPVALIAAALDVEPAVFRDAFRGVRPSSFGPPTAFRAQANKRVLMDALAPRGVTNERLDEVSNYYRYRPEQGEMWPHQPARAKAVMEDGRVTGVELLDGGHGYLSAPHVTIAGYEHIRLQAELAYSRDFARNGRVASLRIVAGSENQASPRRDLAMMDDR